MTFSRLTRSVVRVLRFLFILALVALPVPMATCLAIILTPLRRNLPAEVLRKEDERDRNPEML